MTRDRIRRAERSQAPGATTVVPVLPLKSTVLFPLQVASVLLTAKPSVKLLVSHPSADEIVAAGVWLDPEGPYARKNLCRVGVACRVLDRVRMPDGAVRVVLQGLRRIRLTKIVAARPSSFPLTQAGSKVKKWSITIPALRSAKSIKVINERCMPSIANHSQGRSLRKIASGAKATSRASALQVAIAISGCGSASTVSRKNVGRASGLLSTCASALPSSHEGLASFIKPLYE